MPEAPQTMADLLGKTGPSLSATSDMPASDPAPAIPDPADTGAAATTTEAPAAPEQDAKAADDVKTETDTGADKTGQDTGEKPGDDTPPWMKREITKARNRQREAEAKATAAEARLDAALKALERAGGESASTATRKADEADPKPDRAKFDNPDVYDDALIEWSSRRAATAAKVELQREQTEQQQQEGFRQLQQSWTEKVEKAREDMPDFDDVALSDDLQVSQPMAIAIQSEENGADILYHLGQNPDEAKRIAALPPARQFVEIGKLAASIVKKAEVSKAPPPPRHIGSNARAAQKTPDEESMEEYAARRNAEERARRTSGRAAVH